MRWNKAKVIKYFLGFFIAIFGIMILISIILLRREIKTPLTIEQLDALSLEHVDKLMIVAHPDDESIWGGAHLLKKDYLVVCLTNGDNAVRRKEFYKALSVSNDIPLILNYPDKEFMMRSKWLGYTDDILGDLELLFSYKKWEEIAVHNPQGEYGHVHHKKVNCLVTYQKKFAPEAKLYYFGNYHTKDELKNEKGTDEILSKELLESKIEMLKSYESQNFIWDRFGHMFPYENWIEYQEE